MYHTYYYYNDNLKAENDHNFFRITLNKACSQRLSSSSLHEVQALLDG